MVDDVLARVTATEVHIDIMDQRIGVVGQAVQSVDMSCVFGRALELLKLSWWVLIMQQVYYHSQFHEETRITISKDGGALPK